MTDINPAIATANRETWMNRFLDKARPHFEALGCPIPINTRASIGFPSAGQRSKAIAECWSDNASADGHFEIFIKPVMATDVEIAEALTHEACHAALGMAEDHGPRFRKLATGLGLIGKMTATRGGKGWLDWALPVMQELGPMPYAPITAMAPPKPKKKTYQHKVECLDCGWYGMVNAKWTNPYPYLTCPVPDCGGIMHVNPLKED